MATRTASTIDATPDSWAVTIHVIDASGDTYAEVITGTGDIPLTADVEDWVAAYQAATQASVWKVTLSQMYEGAKSASNADVGQRNSVAQGVNLLYHNTDQKTSTTLRIVAPIPAIMDGNKDIPLVSATQFVNHNTEALVLLPGYALRNSQYTERRERKNNPRV